MNKKGYSLSMWLEVGLGIILLMTCVTLIMAGMNSDYGQSYDSTFGIVTNDTYDDLTGYQSTLQEGMEGEATTSSETGISLGTAWGMIRAGLNIAYNVATGFWIEQAIGLLGLGKAGTILGLILRIAFVLSIGLILIRMILKINP